MVDWKNIGVPIVAALIVGVGALVAALINYIILAIFTPIISITGVSDSNSSNANVNILDITNTGSASAKNLKLTIQAPPHVTFNHTIFSTERYNENKTGDLSLLELYVPRFVQGAGSLISIHTLIAREATPNGSYTFYATYDQGSILRSIPILTQPVSRVSIIDTFRNEYYIYQSFVALILTGVTGISVAFIIPSLVRWMKDFRSRRNLGRFLEEIYRDVGKSRRKTIEAWILRWYVEGRIGKDHLQLLNDKISEYYGSIKDSESDA